MPPSFCKTAGSLKNSRIRRRGSPTSGGGWLKSTFGVNHRNIEKHSRLQWPYCWETGIKTADSRFRYGDTVKQVQGFWSVFRQSPCTYERYIAVAEQWGLGNGLAGGLLAGTQTLEPAVFDVIGGREKAQNQIIASVQSVFSGVLDFLARFQQPLPPYSWCRGRK